MFLPWSALLSIVFLVLAADRVSVNFTGVSDSCFFLIGVDAYEC